MNRTAGPGHCWEDGNYDGNDIGDWVGMGKVNDPSKCKAKCMELPECKFWTFDYGYYDNMRCYRQSKGDPGSGYWGYCKTCKRGKRLCG